MKDLFDCIDILLNRVISGKEKKYAKACWVELNKEAYKSIFEKFSFGRVHNYGYVENTWYGFYFKECPITVSEYFFEYIEYNEEIEEMIARQFGVQREKIESANRVITGILAGLDYDVEASCHLWRNFNHYLRWLEKKIQLGEEKYNRKVFSDRFFQQTAQTDENIKAIGDMCYSYSTKDGRWGLRLMENGVLLSDIIQKYAQPKVYGAVKINPRFPEIKISYDSFLIMCVLIEKLLREFEYEQNECLE